MSENLENIKKTASEKAGDHFTNGFHCAEAVASSVLEVLGEETVDAAAHATAFGGGFGRTFCEACGALSGGLIAIGHLYGRREPGLSWDIPAKMGAELRHRFLLNHGAVQCAILRERFGEEAQMEECRKVVADTACVLLDIIKGDPSGGRMETNAC